MYIYSQETPEARPVRVNIRGGMANIVIIQVGDDDKDQVWIEITNIDGKPVIELVDMEDGILINRRSVT